jgi:hypothetical protein
VTDQGTFIIVDEELMARPEGFEELKPAAIIVLRHQYLARRAAGRTHNQAMSDLIGFTVRL